MKFKLLLGCVYWQTLCCLSVWVCDFDFKEAIPWTEWDNAWQHYWLVSAASSLLFAFAAAKSRYFGKVITLTALVIAAGAAISLAYGWFYLFANIQEDWHYRLFFSTINVSRTMRITMNTLVVLVTIQSAASCYRNQTLFKISRLRRDITVKQKL